MRNFESKFYNPNDGSMFVTIEGESTIPVVDKNHPHYTELKEHFINNEADLFLLTLHQAGRNIKNIAKQVLNIDGFEISSGKITYGNYVIHAEFTKRLLQMLEDGTIEWIKPFLSRLFKNPRPAAIKELYPFIERGGLPITSDGCFLAYKVVNADMTDKYTRTLDYTPGVKIERIPDNMVCDDNRLACSRGYHIGTLEYAGPNGHFYNPDAGERIIVVKVAPEDVVCVPQGETTKVRVTYFESVRELTEGRPMPDSITKTGRGDDLMIALYDGFPQSAEW